jgi:hypothetical protein
LVRKTPFLRHFYIKTNILPRQARGKHRKSSNTGWFFSGRGLSRHVVVLRRPSATTRSSRCVTLFRLLLLLEECPGETVKQEPLLRQARDKHKDIIRIHRQNGPFRAGLPRWFRVGDATALQGPGARWVRVRVERSRDDKGSGGGGLCYHLGSA